MPAQFVISGAKGPDSFLRFREWAIATGFDLTGDPTRGTLEGTPAGMTGLVVGRIRGSYLVSGGQVVIYLEEDLPPNEVSARLERFGLALVRHTWLPFHRPP